MKNDMNTKGFWRWFVENEPLLRQFGTRQAEIDNQMTAKLRELHTGLGYEFGPNVGKEFQLVISPNGRKDLLAVTKQIVANAPKLKDWQFYSAKPPKPDFDGKVQILRTGWFSSKWVKVDTFSWKYVLRAYPDGVRDIVFVIGEDWTKYKKDDLMNVAYIALDSLLGEERMIKYIANVDVLQYQPEGVSEAQLSSFSTLSKHLDTLKHK